MTSKKIAFEYKSVQRIHIPGTPYEDVSNFLQIYGADGWQLVAVTMGQKWYVDEQYEVFYFMRPV